MPRLLEPVLREVDRDDPLRTCQPRPDHRPEPHESAAEDHARRPRLHAGGVESGPDPGREPARERGASVERSFRIDLRERDLGHHRVLRERRRAHEVPQLLPPARKAGGAVRQVPEALLVADRHAPVRALAAAVDALAAFGREQRDHVVPRPDERDAVADPLDHARALVPEHAGRVSRWIRPGRRVQVGVADPAGREAYERLAPPRLGELDVLDDERLPERLEHGGTDLHAAILLACGAATCRHGRLRNSFQNDVSLPGRDGRVGCKDAGSPDMRHIGATEDAAACRPARHGAQGFILKRVLSPRSACGARRARAAGARPRAAGPCGPVRGYASRSRAPTASPSHADEASAVSRGSIRKKHPCAHRPHDTPSLHPSGGGSCG